jgi:hypothetical protein
MVRNQLAPRASLKPRTGIEHTLDTTEPGTREATYRLQPSIPKGGTDAWYRAHPRELFPLIVARWGSDQKSACAPASLRRLRWIPSLRIRSVLVLITIHDHLG